MKKIILLLLLLMVVVGGCSSNKTITVLDTPNGEIIITDLPLENYKEKEFICTKIDCGNENIDELVEQERENQQ